MKYYDTKSLQYEYCRVLIYVYHFSQYNQPSTPVKIVDNYFISLLWSLLIYLSWDKLEYSLKLRVFSA